MMILYFEPKRTLFLAKNYAVCQEANLSGSGRKLHAPKGEETS